MIHQYRPQRFRRAVLRGRAVEIGTIPIGSIVALAQGRVIVEAWLPREITASRRVDGRWRSAFVAGGGHLAQVRRLSDGKRLRIADHHLLRAAA
ncbi:hypothetical protein WV31_10040 [Magnetospirillum sp. ME-1]|uniref:hypothetical protein n=1 Tax=Magnetospirillum sp. ME-1 TaxID=1639348 RepID=UPI000A17DF79|nr:hypothetical protein [Magnetospirillum sp. ME-1]ARJ65968.1 hypothetical protein WV31_10040 [Magnetospirillum sp. ME-1]